MTKLLPSYVKTVTAPVLKAAWAIATKCPMPTCPMPNAQCPI
ncbi:MAG: hypothetical protein V7K86_28235 [Nostoc sp.]